MNVWKLTAPGKLERTETENPAREEGKVRVRVTKVFLNGTDAAIFRDARRAARSSPDGTPSAWSRKTAA